MRTFYQFDLSRLNLREMWRMTSSFVGFTRLMLHKYLRIPVPNIGPFPVDDELHLVEARDLPPEASLDLAPAVRDCASLGMTLAFYIENTGNERKRQGYGASFLSDDGKCWGAAVWVRVNYGAPRITYGMAFCTKFTDGTYFSTTNIKQPLDSPPEYHKTRMRRADTATLKAAHYEALRNMRDKDIVALDVETLKQATLEVRRRTAEFLIRRGVWVPLSEIETARLIAPK
jgi:hypothetical protein